MNLQINEYAKKINELHKILNIQLKTPLNTAIEIGQLLIEVKENVGHGNFLNWIKDNCFFSDKTAQSYMKCYLYKSKIESVSNLNEAYKQIEYIERQEKQKEWQKKDTAIKQKINGNNPDIWDNDCQKEYEKRIDDERFEKRKKDIFDKHKKEPFDSGKAFQDIKDYFSKEQEKINERIEYNSKVKDMNMLYDIIEDYLLPLNNSQKKECFNNLIKYSKKRSIELDK